MKRGLKPSRKERNKVRTKKIKNKIDKKEVKFHRQLKKGSDLQPQVGFIYE